MWDIALHLPLSISQNERALIEDHLDTWTQNLLGLDMDLLQACKKLQKPLRPLWVSPSSNLWGGFATNTKDLAFTPIVLISASREEAGCRRTAVLDEGPGWPYVYVPGMLMYISLPADVSWTPVLVQD